MHEKIEAELKFSDIKIGRNYRLKSGQVVHIASVDNFNLTIETYLDNDKGPSRRFRLSDFQGATFLPEDKKDEEKIEGDIKFSDIKEGRNYRLTDGRLVNVSKVGGNWVTYKTVPFVSRKDGTTYELTDDVTIFTGATLVPKTKKIETDDTEKIPSSEKIIENVVFVKREMKKDRSVLYLSSDPSGARKIIQLDKSSALPEEGKPYRVRVILDTKPENLHSGKYFVEIIEPDIEADLLQDVPVVSKEQEVRELPSVVEINEVARRVYIGETPVTMADTRGQLTPSRAKFEYYTLDERTLAVVEFIAQSVQLKQSCLLTGETATSKTSAIEYLASLSGHEVVRMNLAGQTDTSELIGKYVPNDGQLQIQFEQLLKDTTLLSSASREILERITREIEETGMSRGLTKLEAERIATNENLAVADWRWQDGKVPEAMKRGAWLILDEVNLADPSVRERLNSVLERSPSLVISEHLGEMISYASPFETHDGERKISIRDGFHVFGTQNPAEYGARKPMSEAEKRRWLRRMSVPLPDADQYLLMLRHMIYGERPTIYSDSEKKNIKYVGGKQQADRFLKLREIPNMRDFIQRIAKFHATLAMLASTNQLSRGKKEKEIFTRACLEAFFDYLEEVELVDRSWRPPRIVSFKTDPSTILLKALEQYYVGKFGNNDDRAKVMDQLIARGILSTDGKTVVFDFVNVGKNTPDKDVGMSSARV